MPEHGATFLEVLVAIALLGLVFLPVAYALGGTASLATRSGILLKETTIAQSEMEFLLSQTPEKLRHTRNYSFSCGYPLLYPLEAARENSGPYRVSASLAPFPAEAPLSLEKLTIRVVRTGAAVPGVTLSTLIAGKAQDE